MKNVLFENFGELKYGMYQGYVGLPSIASARNQPNIYIDTKWYPKY